MTSIIQVGGPGWEEGGFGNWLHIYATARKYADLVGAVVQMPLWHGQHIFNVSDAPISRKATQDVSWPPASFEGIANLGSFYNFNCMRIYDRSQFLRYLPFRKDVLERFGPKQPVEVIFHHRDFKGAPDDVGRPHLTEDVFRRAVEKHGLPWDKTVVVDDHGKAPNSRCEFTDYIEDFLNLCFAKHLFMFPCSTFSGFAAFFNIQGRIYAPTANCYDGASDCDWVLEEDSWACRRVDPACVLEGFRR